MAGRPPKKNRKSNGYGFIFPDGYLDKLDMIAKREGISRKALVIKFCEEGFEKHDPGNPQTFLNSYTEGGGQTVNQLVGRIRQKFYSRGRASHREILEAFKSEGVEDGAKRVVLAKRIIEWLKGHGIKVTY